MNCEILELFIEAHFHQILKNFLEILAYLKIMICFVKIMTYDLVKYCENVLK